jgi:hypothetical protein
MRVTYPTILAVAILITSGCVTPEEQTAMDQQRCTGFGFAPGTDSFAKCMMGVSQQREGEQAMQRRQRERDQTIADQMEKDRQAQQQAQNKAASDQSYNDWLRMSGHADMISAPADASDSSSTPSP